MKKDGVSGRGGIDDINDIVDLAGKGNIIVLDVEYR